MKLFLSLAGLLLLAAAVAGLQCYICENCENDYQNKNQTCVQENPEPPVTGPPATGPPATGPPATNPPATNPPATNPPATNPPATNPPATGPPATNPPATNSPVTNPPATNPPVTNPPATNPPVTNPPATNPPVTNPPAPNPPVTNPPAAPGTNEENQEAQEGEEVVENTPEVLLSETHSRFVREVRANETVVRCVSTKYEVNGTSVVRRGCSFGEASDDARCSALAGTNATSGCSVCDADLCNAARAHTLADAAAAAVLLALLVAV